MNHRCAEYDVQITRLKTENALLRSALSDLTPFILKQSEIDEIRALGNEHRAVSDYMEACQKALNAVKSFEG